MKNQHLLKNPKIRSIFVLCLLLIPPFSVHSAETRKNTYEDDEVYMRLVLRTPEQLTAFYQGREFKREAVDEILKTCFVTPIIKNRFFDVLWLELDEWKFIDENNKPIQRIKRDYWKKIWQSIDLELAHQSTFGWTLMPESRDLRFDEGVGGSIVIPWQAKPFTLIANFKTAGNKEGPLKTIKFEGVTCKPDSEQE